MRIDIKGLKLANIDINLNIQENKKLGVFSNDKNLVITFLELVSGINKNHNTIFANDINVFDNKVYFENRIYFDFKNRYLTTLRVKKIHEVLKSYNLDFNSDKFIEICKELNVRGETDISYKYEFTKTGNTFVNLAMLCSVERKNIIINNPTINLNLDSDIEYFKKKLTSHEFNTVILGLNNVSHFKNSLDQIVLFSDFGSMYVVDNNDSLIVFDSNIDKHFLIKDKLFKGKYFIALNTYTKEELKNFQKMKVKYEIINVYDFDKYLGDE